MMSDLLDDSDLLSEDYKKVSFYTIKTLQCVMVDFIDA